MTLFVGRLVQGGAPRSLYDATSEASSAVVIREYSSSFGLASRLLAEPVRTRVRNIYALVRVADEIVDNPDPTLDRSARATMLDWLEGDVAHAMRTGYSAIADEWVPINAGQDGAWWMAVNHVLLKEFHHEKKIPYFLDYTKKYTDAPYLVELTCDGTSYKAGSLLRANRLAKYAKVENGDWQFLMWDAATGGPKMPMGSVGYRWAQQKASGTWS